MIAGSSELACPTCASPMVRRRRRSDGAEFWGCPLYPECRGTRPLSAIEATRIRDGRSTPDGIPGGSARAQFDRRQRRHREGVEQRRPRIIATSAVVFLAGTLVALAALGSNWQPFGAMVMVVAVLYALVSLYELPNHVRAWRTGADGEMATARILAPLSAEGFVILHDRRIPNGRENIDHIVIGPTGVFVIETKNYAGDLRVRDGVLFVDRRRRAGVIDQVRRQANAVSAVLLNVPVGDIVVVHHADFPLLGPQRIDGVPIVMPRGLARLLRDSPIVLDPVEVDRLERLATSNLRAAS